MLKISIMYSEVSQLYFVFILVLYKQAIQICISYKNRKYVQIFKEWPAHNITDVLLHNIIFM